MNALRAAATRIRLTFKQHRFEVAAVAILGGVYVVGGLVEAWRLNSIAFPAGCDPSRWFGGYSFPGQAPDEATLRCMKAQQEYATLYQSFDVSLIGLLGRVLPFLAGVLLGASLVAREVEQRTAPISWVLAGSRRRWLAERMFAMLVLIVPLMLAVAVVSNVFQSGTDRTVDPYRSLSEYTFRGVLALCWALAAFAGTVGLSVLIRRTLPAFVIAIVICVFVGGAFDRAITKFVLPPMAIEQPQPAKDATQEQVTALANSQRGDLWVYTRNKLNGQWWDGDMNQWFMDHQPTMVEVKDETGKVIGASTQPDPNWNPPVTIPFVIPGHDYWIVVGIEGGFLLAGAAFLSLFGLFVVERRRPY